MQGLRGDLRRQFTVTSKRATPRIFTAKETNYGRKGDSFPLESVLEIAAHGDVFDVTIGFAEHFLEAGNIAADEEEKNND